MVSIVILSSDRYELSEREDEERDSVCDKLINIEQLRLQWAGPVHNQSIMANPGARLAGSKCLTDCVQDEQQHTVSQTNELGQTVSSHHNVNIPVQAAVTFKFHINVLLSVK